jgi:hypothetical protein
MALGMLLVPIGLAEFRSKVGIARFDPELLIYCHELQCITAICGIPVFKFLM